MNATHRKLQRSGIWHNNWLLSLIVILFLINIGLTGYTFLQLKPVANQVPIRFTTFTNFDQLGSWQMLAVFPVMSWVISGLNVFLAHSVYRRSRIASVMLIVVSLMLALLISQYAVYFIGVSYGLPTN